MQTHSIPSSAAKGASGIKSVTELELHCVCRLPHSDEFDWAQCNGCHLWFHKECINIPDCVFSNSHDMQWMCKLCQDFFDLHNNI